ncbi:MAG: SPOR domain-containing protein [Melioribacteraceae bacterium]|nr:SPOR domain-containing protein [Melioribacteraceae bacterium]
MKKIFIFLALVSFSACSIFQTSDEAKKSESANDTTDEVYVFDEVSETDGNAAKVKKIDKKLDAVEEKSDTEVDIFDETVSNPNAQNSIESVKYYLQLGAFSTLKRAEIFVNENDSNIDFALSIMYNPKTSLYNVRSTPYNTKAEVEVIKNGFWKRNMFKDAFIVTE